MSSTNSKNIFFCLATLVLITLAKLYFIEGTYTPLWVSEAKSWILSKNIAYGYVSTPPALPILLNFTNGLCGDGEFCLRISSPIIHLITAIVLFFFCSSIYSFKTGLYTALIYITLPSVTLASIFISSETLLIFFWSLALVLFIKAQKQGKYSSFFVWVCLGLSIGLGLLSDYAMLLFPLPIIIYALLYKRSTLFDINILLMLIVAGGIMLPNIFWNMENEYLGFKNFFQSLVFENPEDKSFIGFSEIISYLIGQVGIVGPVLFCLIIFCLFKRSKHSDNFNEFENSQQILKSFFWPIVILGLGLASIATIEPIFAAPAYIAAIILVCNQFVMIGQTFWLKLAFVTNLAIFFIILNMQFFSDSVDFIEGPSDRLYKWEALADPVRKAQFMYPNHIIVSEDKKIISKIRYDLREGTKKGFPIYKWKTDSEIGDDFDYLLKVKSSKSNNIIMITKNIKLEDVAKYFKDAQILTIPEIEEPYKMYKLEGYKKR